MINWHIQKIPIKNLKPHPKNPRSITKDQMQNLTDLIAKFGLIDLPIVNTDMTIIGGHQRIKILKKQKVKEVDCWVPNRELTEEEVNHLCIGHNLNQGNWDYEILANEWEMLDLLEWGFTEQQLLGLESEDKDDTKSLEDDSEVLEPAKDEDAITKLGDLYELGNHRLICGDSTDSDTVNKVMGNNEPILMVTDPPFNHSSENKMVAIGSKNKMAKKLKDSEWDKNFDVELFLDNIKSKLPKNISIYIFTSHHLAGDIWKWMKQWATHYGWCVWKKNNPMPSLMKRHWTWDGELICYATKGKHVFNFPNEGHAHSTFEFSKVSSCDLHPTMKPLPLIGHIITHSSNKNDCILDPFLGSGTTLIAAERLDRKCIGVELSQAYCDVIVRRWIKERKKEGNDYTVIRNGEKFHLFDEN